MSTTWTSMTPVHFDTALAPSKSRARKIVAAIDSAEATLFPDLMPETAPKRTTAAPEPMPGEVPLFDL